MGRGMSMVKGKCAMKSASRLRGLEVAAKKGGGGEWMQQQETIAGSIAMGGYIRKERPEGALRWCIRKEKEHWQVHQEGSEGSNKWQWQRRRQRRRQRERQRERQQ